MSSTERLPQPNRRQRRRTGLVSQNSFRTRFIKHVFAVGAVLVFFLSGSVKGGATSTVHVLLYLAISVILYGVALVLYPLIRQAWLDSRR